MSVILMPGGMRLCSVGSAAGFLMKVPARPEPCERPDWVLAGPEPPAPDPEVMEEKPVATVPVSSSLSSPLVRSGMIKRGWGLVWINWYKAWGKVGV